MINRVERLAIKKMDCPLCFICAGRRCFDLRIPDSSPRWGKRGPIKHPHKERVKAWLEVLDDNS